MRRLFGKAANCKEVLLGRVVTESTAKKYRYNSILVTNTPNKKAMKHIAVLTARNEADEYLLSKKTPLFWGIERIDELKVGDVVRLDPCGNIDVLYEKESPHNGLLVTEQCNCSCLICPQSTTKVKDDRTDFVLKLISLIDPSTKTLVITGGEPTLLGENLLKIIKVCKECLPDTALEILSNGILFSDFDFTKNMALVEHPNLHIGIPLYADTDNEHNHIIQINGFYRTVKGIQNLALFRQRVEIRTVITALNYRRLPQLARFIYRNFPFVVHVVLMGMETRELAKKNIEQVWVDPYEYGSFLQEAVEILTLSNMNVSIYNHQLCLLPRGLWKYAKKSISLWKNIYLKECQQCDYKEECGGFFASSQDIHSKHIQPLKKDS